MSAMDFGPVDGFATSTMATSISFATGASSRNKSGPVLDHDLTSQPRAEFVGHDARGAVGGRPRREGNNDLNRFLRRLCERRPASDRNRENRQEYALQPHHRLPLAVDSMRPLASWIVFQTLYGVAGILMSPTP